MKTSLRMLVLCFLPLLLPVQAEKALSLVELHKQLAAALEKERADHKDWDERQMVAMEKIIQIVRELRPETVTTVQLRQINTYSKPGKFSETTEALLQQFQDQASLQIETRKTKISSEFKEKIRGYLLLAFATTKPEAIADIQRDLVVYGEEINRADHQDVRGSLPANGSIHNPRNVLEYLAKFHTARNSEDWNGMGAHLSSMESALKNVELFLTAKEVMDAMAKLRADSGIVSPQEFEAIYQKMLDSLLDGANQERIEAILSEIRKYRSLSGSASSSSSPASRWDRMSSFASALLQAVERVKDGAVPQFSIDTWTRPDSGYPVLMAKDKLVEALVKYRVKVKADDGRTSEQRLYYTTGELRDASSAILLEMLDDENQDRLEDIQERIRMFQRFSSYGSDQSGMSQRFQQIGSFAQYFIQAVRRIQDGGVPRMNPDEWLRSNPEYGRVMEKDKLLDLLRKYRVRIKNKDGKVTELPLYQEVNDILERIHSAEDIEKELRTLTLISQSSSYESGQSNLAQTVAALTSLAEIHANWKKGGSFALVHAQSGGMYDGSGRSGLPDPSTDNPVALKLEALRNEVERAVLERMVPGLKIDAAGNRDEVLGGLIKKYTAEKNHAAVLAAARVAVHFVPKRPLIPAHELGALQNYLDGVRQQEELGEPRLATMHFQRAAAARSAILPVEELRKRLHQLKIEHPQAYEKGTDDSLSSERPGVPQMSPYPAMPPLVVPGR